jgi:hypothetical protein
MASKWYTFHLVPLSILAHLHLQVLDMLQRDKNKDLEEEEARSLADLLQKLDAQGMLIVVRPAILLTPAQVTKFTRHSANPNAQTLKRRCVMADLLNCLRCGLPGGLDR